MWRRGRAEAGPDHFSRFPRLGLGQTRRSLLDLHYHGNEKRMAVARSKITAQGQISVPAEVRRKLGVGPGSVLEWHEDGDRVIVTRAGRHTSEDVHRAVFSKRRPPARTIDDMKAGIGRYLKTRHARD
jgi:antitoxin PrlF